MFSGVLRAVTELEQCAELMLISPHLDLAGVKLNRLELWQGDVIELSKSAEVYQVELLFIWILV